MTEFLFHLTLWHWLVFGVILLGLEFILLGGGILAWTGLSALVTAAITWIFPHLYDLGQILIFAIVGIVALNSWWDYMQYQMSCIEPDHLD